MTNEQALQALLDFDGDDQSATSDWVRISPGSFAVVQLRRVAENAQLARDDPMRWTDCLLALYRSLTAALTEELSGTDNTGVLIARKRTEALTLLNKQSTDIPDRPVMSLSELVKQATDGSGLYWAQEPLQLSPDQEAAMNTLYGLRNDLEHPKAQLLIVSSSEFAMVVKELAPVVVRVLSSVWHRLTEDERLLLPELLSTILSVAGTQRERSDP